MRLAMYLLALLGASSLAALPDARAQAPADAAAPDLPGRVAASGHGALLDAEGREIEATPELILETQRAYIDHLTARLDEDARSASAARRQRVLADGALSQADLIHANAALIAALIAEARPENAGRLASLNAALSAQLGVPGSAAAGRAGAEGAVPSAAMARILGAEGMPLTARAVTAAAGAQYIEECRAAGVPIPPDWGNPQWRSRGVLNNEFISAGLEAEVFVFESGAPRGVCVALPRSAGNTISLLGVICQGNDTSNVCFWDNKNVPKEATVPLVNFKGGVALEGGDVCTDCHAGRNPYVVHPGTPLDIGSVLTANAWYRPLAPASWPQNPGPTKQLDGIPLDADDRSCIACHGGLPEFSKQQLPGYCAAVMGNAIGRTMPPGDPAAAPEHFKHLDAIAATCGLPPTAAPVRTVMELLQLPLR